MTQWVHVAVAIVLRSSPPPGRPALVLAARRPPNVHLPENWEFPGGKVEPGESSGECARREVWEETGVEVQVIKLLQSDEHVYPDRNVKIDFHLCRYLKGVPQTLACQAVRWVRVDHLEAYPFPPANGRILDALVRGDWKDHIHHRYAEGGEDA